MYPETIAVNLWGLDAIKTKGESVAIALTLVGARPVREGTGTLVLRITVGCPTQPTVPPLHRSHCTV